MNVNKIWKQKRKQHNPTLFTYTEKEVGLSEFILLIKLNYVHICTNN